MKFPFVFLIILVSFTVIPFSVSADCVGPGGDIIPGPCPGDPIPAGGGAGVASPTPGGGAVAPTPGVAAPTASPTPSPRPTGHISIDNPLKADSITEFLTDIIKMILIIATPLIVLMIIVAGFMYVMAQGKPDKISQANKALLFALIGGLLILGAFVILRIIEGTVAAFMS